MLDSVVNADKKYRPQIFLKECKYEIKNRKIMNTINKQLKLDKTDDDKYDEEYIYSFKY